MKELLPEVDAVIRQAAKSFGALTESFFEAGRAFAPLRQYAEDRLSGKIPPPDLAKIERDTRSIIGCDFAEGQSCGCIISAEQYGDKIIIDGETYDVTRYVQNP